MSSRRLLGAHLPASFPERRETVAGECLGCQTQFAVDVRLPLPAVCPDCGGDVLARLTSGSGAAGPRGSTRCDSGRRNHDAALHRGRTLRELIELAERDAAAELVDALHDALDVASPAGRLEH